MNQALRLAEGQTLYSDVRHIYGPLSPYLNAGLFKIFGPSLGVLCGDGIVTALIIVGLVYWLSRQLMGRIESTAATLSVMWLCAFKQAGNYILPYSFAALHGSALGLSALAILVGYMNVAVNGAGSADRSTTPPATRRAALMLVAAGFISGLALLAKTEMGIPCIAAGAAAVLMTGPPKIQPKLTRLSLFLAPAAAVLLAVYGAIAARIGLRSLFGDSFLLLFNMPPELVFFNKRMSGFDDPLSSVAQMAAMALRIALFAGFLGLLCVALSRRGPRGNQSADAAAGSSKPRQSRLWLGMAACLILFAGLSLIGNMQLEKGPYLAMPILLIALMVAETRRMAARRRVEGPYPSNSLVILLMSVYALVSLFRVLLRVRSGGAYASYLLPASVILFVLCASTIFPNLVREPRAARMARGVMLTLIFVWVVGTALVFARRYNKDNTFTLTTPRGTMRVVPDLGVAFTQAMEFVGRETGKTEPVVVLPEGTSINFFTGRPNPLREEITTPGFLDDKGEERAISQIEQSGVRFVLIANRPTPEFGPVVFGRDYCTRLMGWIDRNYTACAVFGRDQSLDPRVGDRAFFIRAYKRNGEARAVQ